MISSRALKHIVAEARPIIERQLDDAEIIAGLRDVVASQGGDWSALKALIKAQIQDERDETGNGKRVKKIIDKADFSTGYADMLGWRIMNEKNFSAEEEDFNPFTGEITESPRKAAEAVAEMPRTNPVANVEEEATGAIAAASSDPASRTDEGGERQHSSTVGFTGDCRTEGKEQSDASAASVGDADADAHGIPATDQPQAGGDHVEREPSAATHQAGPNLVSDLRPAAHPVLLLRPNCKRAGEETCGGSGSKHCRECMAAMREEVA
jgi:hypothetical protein